MIVSGMPAVWVMNLLGKHVVSNIVRNDKSFTFISGYIVNNPKNWQDNKFYD